MLTRSSGSFHATQKMACSSSMMTATSDDSITAARSCCAPPSSGSLQRLLQLQTASDPKRHKNGTLCLAATAPKKVMMTTCHKVTLRLRMSLLKIFMNPEKEEIFWNVKNSRRYQKIMRPPQGSEAHVSKVISSMHDGGSLTEPVTLRLTAARSNQLS